MKKIYSYLSLLIVMLLMGCQSAPQKPEVQIVYETKYVLIEPPSKFYQPVALIAPPEKDLYRDMTCPAKENALTDLYIKQNKIIATANQNFKAISDWVTKQKANAVEDKNDKK